jgi:septum formation protein
VLILASASPIRAQMLRDAGVEHRVLPADLDEAAVKGERPGDVALELAKAKALAVVGEWVIGSDSIVTVAGRRFDKPASREQAADHLRSFSGQEMVLTSAVALAHDGAIDWAVSDSATLHVRSLSGAFIEEYLDAEWPDVGYCVGVFRLEGRGVQLFECIEGSHFTILGMPLLPLLGALRERRIIPR